MYGVSQETVSADDIEKYSLTEKNRTQQIKDIKQFTGVEEVALLTTDLRNEYYLHVDETIFKHGDLLRYLCEFTEKPLKEVILETYSKFNEDVIRHLFSIASGMEAIPKGSIEPLKSTEEALTLSREENTIGFVLKDLFERAIEYAREIRMLPSMAPINQVDASKSVRLLKEELSDFRSKRFVLFGNGYEVCHLAKTLLCASAESVTIANANYQASEMIVRELENWEISDKEEHLRKIHVSDLNDVLYRLASADGIIISSSVKHAWFSEELINQMKELRQTKKKQVIVDLSDAQEEYLFAHQSMLRYYHINDSEKENYTDEAKEEALTYFDESLLYATDNFMKRYEQFMDRKERTSVFSKPISEVGS